MIFWLAKTPAANNVHDTRVAKKLEYAAQSNVLLDSSDFIYIKDIIHIEATNNVLNRLSVTTSAYKNQSCNELKLPVGNILTIVPRYN